MGGFISSNHEDQERVRGYIQSSKKEKKNTLPGKVVFQKFSQQTKPKGVYHHLSGLIRNAERSFSS